MKIFNKVLPVALAALTFVGCKDNDDYSVGEWNASTDYAALFFPKASESIELDPTEATTKVIEVGRRNTVGELTVNFDIAVNDSNVFEVSPAVFADGDSIAEVTIDFPNAATGITYNLQLTTDDENLVSYYTDYVTYSLSVTRVKWNDTGFYRVNKNKDEILWEGSVNVNRPSPWPSLSATVNNGDSIPGWCLFTDDFISSVFSIDHLTYPVRVQERDDRPGIYRIINAYGEGYPYNDPGDWDVSQDYYIVINAEDPDKVYCEPYTFNLGLDWGYGAFKVLNLAGNYVAGYKSTENEDYLDTAEEYYGTLKNGKITFPMNSFYIAMANYSGGGWNFYGNANGLFTLVLNPDEDLYVADLEKDFKWNALYEGEFYSSQLNASGPSTLYEGVCTTTTDSCDYVFAATYGTAYKLEAPYAEGYDLIFCVDKDGVNTADKYELQPIGISAMGEQVYAKINNAGNPFNGKTLVLSITFVNKDGSIEYGTATEIFSAVSWKVLGQGVYTEDLLTTFWNIENLSYEVEIQENEDVPGHYRLKNPYGEAYPYNDPGDWDDSKDYYMEIHAENPEAVYIPFQELGFDWGDGMISIWSMADYNGSSFGTLKDGVITFPEESLLISMANYNNGGLYYANLNGAFKVVLPEAANGIKLHNAPAKTNRTFNRISKVATKSYTRNVNWTGNQVIKNRRSLNEALAKRLLNK